MNYIDCHVHIDFYDNPELIVQQYESNRIYAIFVTNLPELFERFFPKMRQLAYVRIALGYHPEMVTRYEFSERLFNEYILKTNYVGESGIDGSLKQNNYLAKQATIFDYITQPKFSRGRIYSIHSRGAEQEVLKILSKNNVKHAIFHWYTGKISNIQDIAAAGYFFSVNPKMVESERGRAIVKAIPTDKLLFETDGPFIKVNKRIVNPLDISAAYQKVSLLVGTPNLQEIIYQNFKTLLFKAHTERLGSEKANTNDSFSM